MVFQAHSESYPSPGGASVGLQDVSQDGMELGLGEGGFDLGKSLLSEPFIL